MGKALPPPAREGRRVLKAASGREGTSYRPGGARRSMPVGQQGAPAGAVTAAERPFFSLSEGVRASPLENRRIRVEPRGFWPRPFVGRGFLYFRGQSTHKQARVRAPRLKRERGCDRDDPAGTGRQGKDEWVW